MRVLLVTNPRSSKYRKVRSEVAGPIRDITQNLVEFEIQPSNFDANVRAVARRIEEGDLVIAAGGDGTVAITGNGVIVSGKKNVQLGVLGYGNFNDLSHTVSGEEPDPQKALATRRHIEFYPLRVEVNGKLLRYAFMYADIGLVAGSVNEFEKDSKRRSLQAGILSNQLMSLLSLAPYYFRHRGRGKLPESSLDLVGATDFFAVNGDRVAKFKVGRGFYRNPDKFGIVTLDTSRVFRNLWFILRSLRGDMPLKRVDEKVIEFARPAELDFQADGEYRRLEGVKTLRFVKSTTPVDMKKMV